MADLKEKERILEDIDEIYMNFKDMSVEQKLKFQGFFFAMSMLRSNDKEKNIA